MKEWLIRHAVRSAAVVASIAPVGASLLDTLPWKWAVSLSAVVLVGGEVAQRIGNSKTIRAYLTTPSE